MGFGDFRLWRRDHGFLLSREIAFSTLSNTGWLGRPRIRDVYIQRLWHGPKGLPLESPAQRLRAGAPLRYQKASQRQGQSAARTSKSISPARSPAPWPSCCMTGLHKSNMRMRSRFNDAWPAAILFGLGVPLRAVRPEPVEGLPLDRLRANGVFLKRTVLWPAGLRCVSSRS